MRLVNLVAASPENVVSPRVYKPVAAAATDEPMRMIIPFRPREIQESDEPLPARRYLTFRYGVERLIAFMGLVLVSPLIALAALAVKLTSRGPAFYSQTRAGKNGELYSIYKLRTMIHNAEAYTGPIWASEHDPRITPVGRFLRLTHLDELPQLLNVVLGQMSLIGPRPERPELVARLVQQVDRYSERMQIRPGITGLAQVLLPPDHCVSDVKTKTTCDLHYIANVSAWMDCCILLGTALSVLHLPVEWRQWLLSSSYGSSRPTAVPMAVAD